MCFLGAPNVQQLNTFGYPYLKHCLRLLFFPVEDYLLTGNPLLKVLSLSIDLRGSETLIAVFYLSPVCTAFGNWPDMEQNPGISSFPNDPAIILYWPNSYFKDKGEKNPPQNQTSLWGQGQHISKHLLVSGLQWWNRKRWVARASDRVSLQWIIR